MTNVTPFGKKSKTTPPPPPTHGDMTGYTIARAISKHFGIAITNTDAIKLDRELRAMVFHSMQQARAEEREACVAAIRNVQAAYDVMLGPGPSVESSVCSDCIGAINARGANG